MNLVIGLIFGAFCFIQTGLSCSLATTPISRFSESEFIFIGKITGYTGPVRSKDKKFEAHGIVVSVKESINLPEIPKSNFEVFPISLWADCSLGGLTSSDLLKSFPVGAEVRVIATKADILPQNEDGSNVRLEELPGGLSSIAINTDKNGNSVTSVNSLFDYGRHFESKDRGSLYNSYLASFEFRKDLHRLKRSTTQKERDAILTRLGNVPYVDDMDYFGVARNYARNEIEADGFYESNLKAFSMEAYDQYMGVKNARIELEKRGYRSEDIKTAMDRAMSEGAGFTAGEIVKGALKYLPELNKK